MPKMTSAMILLVLLSLPMITQSKEMANLPSCDLTFEEETICKTVKVYESNEVPEPHPLILAPTFTLHDIVEVDDEKNSLTILVDVSVEWNDTRLTMKGTNKSEYEYPCT